jgi:hypothetical protein
VLRNEEKPWLLGKHFPFYVTATEVRRRDSTANGEAYTCGSETPAFPPRLLTRRVVDFTKDSSLKLRAGNGFGHNCRCKVERVGEGGKP